jgi:hypothetical protein
MFLWYIGMGIVLAVTFSWVFHEEMRDWYMPWWGRVVCFLAIMVLWPAMVVWFVVFMVGLARG